MFKFFKEIKEAIQEGIAEANEELAEEKKQEEEQEKQIVFPFLIHCESKMIKKLVSTHTKVQAKWQITHL